MVGRPVSQSVRAKVNCTVGRLVVFLCLCWRAQHIQRSEGWTCSNGGSAGGKALDGGLLTVGWLIRRTGWVNWLVPLGALNKFVGRLGGWT